MLGQFPQDILADFYAAYAEAAKTQKDCGPGERVVFGKCAKGDNMGNKQIDEAQKKERASTGTPDNSKPVMVNGKRMGWAVLNGKKVLVDYGSVAGEKKPAAKPKSQQEKTAQPSAPPPKRQAAQTLSNANATGAERQAAINEIGRRAFEH
jgi:hypothetical protein